MRRPLRSGAHDLQKRLRPVRSRQVGTRQDGLHEPLRQPTAAMLLEDEHVAQPGEGRAIRHYTRKSHLFVTDERGRDKGVVDRALEDAASDADRPVGLPAQPA